MNNLLNIDNMRLAASFIAQRAGVEMADLSQVDDPIGRVDYLMSRLVERGVRSLAPEAQMTYHAARPLIDGYLAKVFKERVKVPPEVVELVKAQLQQRMRGAE